MSQIDPPQPMTPAEIDRLKPKDLNRFAGRLIGLDEQHVEAFKPTTQHAALVMLLDAVGYGAGRFFRVQLDWTLHDCQLEATRAACKALVEATR
jgi:hypothetical protein